MSDSELKAPIEKWLAYPLPRDVKAAIERLSQTDDVARVAIMPDAHLSHDICVGTVLATRRLIYPSAVGGDIGCGMAAVAFDADADIVRNENNAAMILSHLPRWVPAMRHSSRDYAPTFSREAKSISLSDGRLESIRRRDGVVQLGTLGRGNHFIEFQSDQDNRLWLMIHSGSRAMGPAIRDLHVANARKSAIGLPYLHSQAAEGRDYLADMQWARLYARDNRHAMAGAVTQALKSLLGIKAIESSYIDCDHNHVRKEIHFGETLWVHRKGAASAADGEAGIIPGSMGTESYHVTGRGCAESLCSSSHGAGRAMSRAEASRSVSVRALGRQLSGVWYDRRLENSLREEAPSAYKDIRIVMRAQRELVRIMRRLKPVMGYKGP